MRHLLKQARKTKCNKLTVDILKNIAEPTLLLTDQIRQSIEHWNKWFPTLVESSGSTMDYISSSTMTIEFDLLQTRPPR
jgi:phosphatidate phosphatase APP1